METLISWREAVPTITLLIALLFGTILVVSSIFLAFKQQKFTSVVVLAVAGVVLMGFSLFKSLAFSVGGVKIIGEFQVVQSRQEISVAVKTNDVGSTASLSADELNEIQVKQEAIPSTRVDPADPDHKFTSINFSVSIKEGPKIGKTPVIDKVIYKLDKRWFNPSEIGKTDRDTNFAFSIAVWGSTHVRVEVYMTGDIDKPSIVREGLMNLQGTVASWGT